MALDGMNVDATVEKDRDDAAAEDERLRVTENDRKRRGYVCTICRFFIRSFIQRQALVSHEYLTQRHDSKLEVRMLCHTTSEKG